MPHFVYSQSAFFQSAFVVYSQAAFAALEQIKNASSNVDFKSALSAEGAQQETATTIPRSFIFMWRSSREREARQKAHCRTSGNPSSHVGAMICALLVREPRGNKLRQSGFSSD